MKITPEDIEELSRKASQTQRNHFLWDSGFGAKATPKGRVFWVAQKWQGGRKGKSSRVVLGYSPPMSLNEAYIKFLTPTTLHRTNSLLGDTVELFIQENSRLGSYWHEMRQTLEREVVSVLGAETSVFKITKTHLRYIIEDKKAKAPFAARKLYSFLRVFFKWCVEKDLIEVSPLVGVRQPIKAQARDRVLTDAEIVSFWRAAEKIPIYGPGYRLLFLTGQRLRECTGMSWREVDMDKGIWIIPRDRTKNNREHLVHLSKQALAILASIPKKEGTDFVFPSRANTPIESYSKVKIHLDILVPQMRDWRIHDLRRTCASGMASIGIQPYIIERILNHSLPGLIGVYQRYDYAKERKEALEAWGTHVENLTRNFP